MLIALILCNLRVIRNSIYKDARLKKKKERNDFFLSQKEFCFTECLLSREYLCMGAMRLRVKETYSERPEGFYNNT